MQRNVLLKNIVLLKTKIKLGKRGRIKNLLPRNLTDGKTYTRYLKINKCIKKIRHKNNLNLLTIFFFSKNYTTI